MGTPQATEHEVINWLQRNATPIDQVNRHVVYDASGTEPDQRSRTCS